MKYRTSRITCLVLILSALALAQDVASFEKRVTLKKLPNGLTLLICERPEAPVFSFFTLRGCRFGARPDARNRSRPHV